MKIAVLSGKGGTGKTLVSVNLSAAAQSAQYIDCDVEEPNGHLFFKPENISAESVAIKLPQVNAALCTGCRKCVDFCKFNALAFVKNTARIFPNVCHSCGGCALLCPEKAITEIDKSIGEIRSGVSENVRVSSGILNTGEESGVPIIKKLMENAKKSSAPLTIIDCPPGSACVVTAAIRDADFCVLVAEPTVFGAHNLSMVYELVRLFGKPHGVVLNKCLEGENPSEVFCKERGIPILGRIPFDKTLGEINSQAKIAVRDNHAYKKLFTDLLETVKKEARHETAPNS
ncbi:MAG: ATP-binding protein [Oscillospiraceae bacterium]